MKTKLEEIISLLYVCAGLLSIQTGHDATGKFLIVYALINMIYCVYLAIKEAK